MTGCVIPRRGIYYVRLTYYDMNHRRRDKWVSTGLSGRGAKQKATAMIDQMIEQYSYLETNAHPTKMAEYLLMWKEIRRTEVAESTFDSWNTYINRHLVPNPVISTFIKLFEHFVASPEILFFYSLMRKSMGHLVFKNLYMLYKAIVFNATIKDISLTHQYFCDIINMSIRE